MCGESSPGRGRQPTEPMLLDPAPEQPIEDLEEWDGLSSPPLWDDLWDAFERDDEVAEPQPEYGDFWGEPDDEEDI
jgi:hypothetical protein